MNTKLNKRVLSVLSYDNPIDRDTVADMLGITGIEASNCLSRLKKRNLVRSEKPAKKYVYRLRREDTGTKSISDIRLTSAPWRNYREAV